MSIKQIKKAVKKSQDDFENGTLLTWVAEDRYMYAAIKTPVGWYTTGSRNAVAAGFVKEVMTFDEILEVMMRRETTQVRVIGLSDGTVIE